MSVIINGREYTADMFKGYGYTGIFPEQIFADMLAEIANATSPAIPGAQYLSYQLTGYYNGSAWDATTLANLSILRSLGIADSQISIIDLGVPTIIPASGTILLQSISLRPVVSPLSLSGIVPGATNGTIVLPQVSVQPVINAPAFLGIRNGVMILLQVSIQPVVSPPGLEAQSPPAAPAEANESSGPPGQLLVVWSAVAGATSYNVYANTILSMTGATLIANVAAPNVTYEIDSGLTPGVMYYCFVSAINGAGASAATAVSGGFVTAATPVGFANGSIMLHQASIQPVVSPPGLAGVQIVTVPTVTAANSPAQITASWNAISGANFYYVYYNTGTITGSERMPSTTSGRIAVIGNSCTLNGLTPSTTYNIKVGAVTSGGIGILSANITQVAGNSGTDYIANPTFTGNLTGWTYDADNSSPGDTDYYGVCYTDGDETATLPYGDRASCEGAGGYWEPGTAPPYTNVGSVAWSNTAVDGNSAHAVLSVTSNNAPSSQAEIYQTISGANLQSSEGVFTFVAAINSANLASNSGISLCLNLNPKIANGTPAISPDVILIGLFGDCSDIVINNLTMNSYNSNTFYTFSINIKTLLAPYLTAKGKAITDITIMGLHITLNVGIPTGTKYMAYISGATFF